MRAAGTADRTVEMYVDIVNWFAGWLGASAPSVRSWEQVGRDEIREFYVWLRTGAAACPHNLTTPDGGRPCTGYGKGYINNAGRCLQQFFAWLAAEEDIPNPAAKVSVPAAPKPDDAPPPVLTQEQMEALVGDAERSRRFEDRRDAAILRLFAATGARLGEITGLTMDDVSPQTREATVTGKGDKVRIVKFDHRCALAVDRYMRVRSRHPAAHLPGLWLGVRRRQQMTSSGIYQALRRRARRLGFDLHPHLLRHTFAHRWLDAGGAEGDLMELVGWTSAQMLRHYGRSARGARARRAYDRIDVMGGI